MQRFRVLKPSSQAIAEALESALGLPEPPKRIECFDISHIQGSDTVASMVVWEDGRMKKSDYRKFIIRGEAMAEGAEKSGGGFCATISPACAKRWSGATGVCSEEKKPLPSLILIDGGIGQLHAAAQALEKLEIINQPMASIAKKEEILYVLGREDEPMVLERHSPVLHLIQQIRDETHRFAVTFHRQRRSKPAVAHFVDRDSRRGAAHRAETAAAVWQRGAVATTQLGGTGGGDSTGAGAARVRSVARNTVVRSSKRVKTRHVKTPAHQAPRATARLDGQRSDDRTIERSQVQRGERFESLVKPLRVAHHGDRNIRVSDGRRPACAVDHVQDSTGPRRVRERSSADHACFPPGACRGPQTRSRRKMFMPWLKKL